MGVSNIHNHINFPLTKGINKDEKVNNKYLLNKEKFLTILKAIPQLITFPLRYLGSKTWSIPGIILRTPLLLFKRIFFQEPLTQAKFFGSGYHFNPQKEITVQQSKELLRYVAFGLIPFRYEQDKWAKPFGAQIVSPLKLPIDLSEFPGDLEAHEFAFIDKKNYFKAMVIEDENEWVVTFGALHSHWPDFPHSEGKKKFYGQLLSTVANYAGFTPQCYDQAEILVKELQKMALEKGKRLIVTGQSKAGAIAAYVSLKQEIPGICFNSVPLGAGLQSKIGEAKLANAEKFLTQVAVKGELVSNLSFFNFLDRTLSLLGIRTVGNFGNRAEITSAFASARDSHDFPVQSFMKKMGYDNKISADKLNKEDIINSTRYNTLIKLQETVQKNSN